jgi:DNA-binding transcriptional regulator YdaS (Cro superfamily)
LIFKISWAYNRNMSNTALKKAIENAGGCAALAKKLGISPPAVSQWKRVPHTRVLTVEKLTGVSRYQLRPDLYGSSPEVAA